jgi:hypothetical protein
MPAGGYDFSRANSSQMEQGARFLRPLVWAASVDGSGNPVGPFSLVGYQARMMLRVTKTAAGPPVLAITSASGRIKKGDGTTFGAGGHTDGTILIDVPDEDTAALTVAEADSAYFYDLEVEDSSGNVTRLLEGKVTVTAEVTR